MATLQAPSLNKLSIDRFTPNFLPSRQAGEFTPLDLADLLVFHDAREGVQTSGLNVTQWDDLSGNSNHAVDDNNAATPPQYLASHANFNNLPAIDMSSGLNARLEYLAIDSLAISDFTFTFVIDTGATFANQTLFDTQTGRLRISWKGNSGDIEYFDGTIKQVGTPVEGAQIITYRFSQADGFDLFINGLLVASNTYTQQRISGATGLGGRPLGLGASLGFAGYMGGFVLVKRAISDVEVGKLENYFSPFV